MSFIQRFVRNLRFWGGALSDHSGEQIGVPSAPSSSGGVITPDKALQLATVYACVDKLANTVAAFPCMVYRTNGGNRRAADETMLWTILHDSPNAWMTPMDFWRALVVQLMLRGNAYAFIDRDPETLEAKAMYPLAADQMTDQVLDGKQVYLYYKDGDQTVYPADAILHLKALGTGYHGFSKLEFMTDSLNEAVDLQGFSGTLARTASKPSGIFTVKHALRDDQRTALQEKLSQFKYGDARFMFVESDMDFKQIAMSPQESQILDTRKFSTEEICRWFGVPPQLIGGGTTASWGNGIEQITEGFEKYTVRPMVVGIEQAITKRLLTAKQRRKFTVEFSMTNLLRASIKDRYSVYSTAVQNGLMTRNEVRAMENLAPQDGADDLTAQTSLAPLSMLGKTANNGEPGTGRVMKS
jgi:HK97 family phage portal protein